MHFRITYTYKHRKSELEFEMKQKHNQNHAIYNLSALKPYGDEKTKLKVICMCMKSTLNWNHLKILSHIYANSHKSSALGLDIHI